MERYSHEGDANLDIIEKADKYTDWMYGEIRPFLRGNILELGSGRGTYSKKIITDFPRNSIILSDIDPAYVSTLKKNLANDHVSALRIDLGHTEDFSQLTLGIDSAIALNVLEHVQDDVLALKNVHKTLNPGGTFIVNVPAHMFLFNRIDKSLGHYRRYSKSEIMRKAALAGFKVRKVFYFNFPLMFGWYWNGNILKSEVFNEPATKIFNLMVPAIRIFEKYLLGKKMGAALIIVLEK